MKEKNGGKESEAGTGSQEALLSSEQQVENPGSLKA